MNSLLSAFKLGSPIIVFDEHREEEGDFFLLAEHVTPEKINFLFEKAKGMICTACAPEILERLQLPLLTENNENPHGTNFCMPVDATEGITTGVSAGDRAKTIQILANPDSKPEDLVRPGHSFPLLAKDPSQRFGHTEAAVELAKKVGAFPCVVICEILNKEGAKANRAELQKLAKEGGFEMVDLEELRNSLN